MDETLPEELALLLVQRIAERAGIRVPDGKRWLLTSRLRDRALHCSQPSVRSYVQQLLASSDEAELEQLIEALRVGETQFFRHKAQLKALARVALPDVVARREAAGTKGIRVWSAGCASGEEPYTVAMLLEDAYPEQKGYAHEILATDLSQVALDHAREGRYPAASIREVPERIAGWAFEAAGTDVVVSARARKIVRFARRNLLEAIYPTGFDLVLCRNVLIYFDRTTQREVMSRLAGALRPGGYLALGYSERIDVEQGELVPVRTDEGVLYRRLALGEERPGAKPVQRSAAPRSTPPPAPRSEPPPKPKPSSRPPRAQLAGEASEREALVAIGQLLRDNTPCLDLRELKYADENVGRLLARAASTLASDGRTLRVLVRAPSVSQFLKRHGVVPPAEIAEDEP